MKTLLTAALFLLQLFCYSQKREEIFDHTFRPADRKGAYYFVVTEKKDSGWQQKAWYISQKTQYMDGWYKDDSATIKNGEFRYFHVNQVLREIGRYENNKKEGVWLRFDEEGRLTDSSNYTNGKKIGIGLGYHKNGYLADSTNFDGNGNGVQVRWYNDGFLYGAGRWKNDTLRYGRWKYYYRNGATLATEDYGADGKLIVCNCYDSTGLQLDTAFCGEKEAIVDKQKWRRHLEKSLQPLVEQKANQGLTGTFTVLVRFLVNKDGKLEELKALTTYGHGIEEAVIKIIKDGPAWQPGSYHGQKVKSYHTQPITFMISDGR